MFSALELQMVATHMNTILDKENTNTKSDQVRTHNYLKIFEYYKLPFRKNCLPVKTLLNLV